MKQYRFCKYGKVYVLKANDYFYIGRLNGLNRDEFVKVYEESLERTKR